jgi:predicted acyl esterase
LLVSPYNHGDGYDQEHGIAFPKGNRGEQFGSTYAIDWFDHIRKGTPLPFQKGVITYYRAFENRWESDFSAKPTTPCTVSLGKGVRAFRYDPLNPPSFSGEGVYAREENAPTDFVRVFTPPFHKDIFIKGQMQAVLAVDCNCPDTSLYVRISLVDETGAYVLRHDITSLCYQLGGYEAGAAVTLNFSFDEYAFLLKKGQRLQIDIAGTDDNSYVCHTNRIGAYALQTGANIAETRVHLEHSCLILPVE